MNACPIKRGQFTFIFFYTLTYCLEAVAKYIRQSHRVTMSRSYGKVRW